MSIDYWLIQEQLLACGHLQIKSKTNLLFRCCYRSENNALNGPENVFTNTSSANYCSRFCWPKLNSGNCEKILLNVQSQKCQEKYCCHITIKTTRISNVLCHTHAPYWRKLNVYKVEVTAIFACVSRLLSVQFLRILNLFG